MKKKLFDEKREKLIAQNQEARAKYIWECVRRNRDYIEDFQKYGNQKLPEKIADEMREKWGLGDKLPNPYELYQESDPHRQFVYPSPDDPICRYNLFHSYGTNEIYVAPPNPDYVQYDLLTGEEIIFKEWTVFDFTKGKYEKLTQGNCPDSISIHINIKLSYPKSKIESLILETFENAYNVVINTQKATLRKKSSRPRLSTFKQCIQVYDLKTTKPKMEWSEIAKRIFPEEVEKHKAPHRKTRKNELPLRTAIDKVRHYYRQADKMINKGGWREI
jgi:hypothetical protein